MNMKRIFFGLVILIGVFGISMTIDKTEIPKAVKEAFSKKYPTAKKVEWETEENGEEETSASMEEEYEVQFKLNGNKTTAKFKADGSWLETESELKKSDLPQMVQTAIAAQFSGYDLNEVELVETPEIAKAYEVKLENEKNDSEVKALFSPDGTLLSQKVKDKNDNETEGEEENEENGNHE